MMDWLASLGKEMGEQYIKSTVMDMLTPDQQAMLQSGMPLSQVAPGLQEYLAQQQAQQQAMMTQPMFRAQGGPIDMTGGMLSGYNPNGPLAFTNIGKKYDPYSYVYQPSTPVTEEASVPAVCPVGTMLDPSTGQCVPVATSETQEVFDPLSPAAIASRSNDGINTTRQMTQDMYDNPAIGVGLGLLNPLAGAAYQAGKAMHNSAANEMNKNGGSSTWQLNTNRGFGTNGPLQGLGLGSIGGDKDVYTSSWGKEYDVSNMGTQARAGLEKINKVADVKSYEDDWTEANPDGTMYTSDLYYKDGKPIQSYKSLMNKAPSKSFSNLFEDPFGNLFGSNTKEEAAAIPVEERDTTVRAERQDKAQAVKAERVEAAIAKREAAEEQRKAEEAKRKAEEEAKRAADIKAATINRNTNAILNSGGNSYNWGSASSDSRQSSKLDSGTGSGIGSGGGNASRGFSTGGW